MRSPARALRPLVVLAVAAASFGCIAPATWAEDMSVAVTSDSGNHVVVDVDLNGGAPNGGLDGKDVEKDGQGIVGFRRGNRQYHESIRVLDGGQRHHYTIGVFLLLPADTSCVGHDSHLLRIDGVAT